MRASKASWLALLLVLLVVLEAEPAHAADPDLFTRGLARGPVSAGLTAFIGGLLVCLTPCVYPTRPMRTTPQSTR
jgi:thiol:disulfide interchange protein DsbD